MAQKELNKLDRMSCFAKSYYRTNSIELENCIFRGIGAYLAVLEMACYVWFTSSKQSRDS